MRDDERTSTIPPISTPFGETFTAPTTVATLADNPNPPTITTDAATGVSFFAGETDDPESGHLPPDARCYPTMVLLPCYRWWAGG